MSLTKSLLLIIAIPCAVFTLGCLIIGYMILRVWWDEAKRRYIPGYTERSKRQVEELFEWARKMEELEKPGAKQPFFVPRRPF